MCAERRATPDMSGQARSAGGETGPVSIGETKRLRLRELTADDLDSMCAVWTDPQTLVHWTAVPDRTQVSELIDRQIRNYRELGYGLWALELRETGEFIGDCGLVPLAYPGADVEIGFHIARTHWGRGYAPEAAQAALTCGWSRGFTTIGALILPVNQQSQRVAQKLGMQIASQVVHASRPHDLWTIAAPSH